MVRKAVILAGGMGTRFLPVTKSFPKEMLPIVDKPALQYIVEEIYDAGITDIAIIINNDKEAVKRYFSPNPELENKLLDKKELLAQLRDVNRFSAEFIIQQQPLGSAHAVNCAKEYLNGSDFALLNGDDVVFNAVSATKQLADCFNATQRTVIGVQKVDRSAFNKYGIIKPTNEKTGDDRTLFIDTIIEKPKPKDAPSEYASLGRYVIKNEVFDVIKDLKPAPNGELQLTDALNILAQQGRAAAYVFEGRRYDLGSKIGYLEANIEYALRRPDLAGEVLEFLKTLNLGK